ncbi:hypothetical protein HH214_15720 [Mucilaginibacter robiniae]|uniref:DUF3828 domain-containing protein n=1 Tax=Mucilaginibacter robiniae TaxID=2728022 RepID=A0A7L5E8L2_9SPHI|nr:hypothetical protein [Mucilaginibacter robiniae]QJD97213.1 hypothetical protein HH214_15720 [Mucilaginibacter robiniae]
MKKSIGLLLLLTLPFLSPAQNLTADKGAAMLKTFYTAYISLSSGENADLEASEAKLLALRRKYCTPACLKQFKILVEETDGDPIIKAQDSYKELIKTLVIKKDLKKPNRYAVSYIDLQGTHEKTTIYVTLIEQSGALKIAHLE